MTNVRNVRPADAYGLVKAHLETIGNISIRDAMAEYGMSGGHLTKVISTMRRNGLPIVKDMRKNIITGRKYARYYIPDSVLTVTYEAAE